MKVCIICTHAPYGSTLARDGIETLLVAASYDMDASALFMGDGVLQLLADQNPTALPQKNTGSMLQALEMYGIEKALICVEDLQERGLSQDHLIPCGQLISRADIPGIIRQQERVLNF